MPRHILAYAERNRTLPCAARGCQKLRFFTRQWCKTHRERHRRYGHPEGRLVPTQEHRRYGSLARKHLRRCPEGTRRVMLRILADILNPGPCPPRSPMVRGRPTNSGRASQAFVVWQELQRISRVPDLEAKALSIITSLFLLSHFNPEALPDDVRLTRNLAHGVLRLAPRPLPARSRIGRPRGTGPCKPAGATVTALLGEKIRDAFAAWFVHLASSPLTPRPPTNRLRDERGRYIRIKKGSVP